MMKMLKPLDLSAEKSKLLVKIRRACIKARCMIGEIQYDSFKDCVNLTIENDGVIGDDYIVPIVQKHARIYDITCEEFKESYDWKADHYTRPCTLVSFRFR